jgi:ElaB/YqjD/DUF883 family membrane-anchored ribosome-binding protein
MRRFLLLGTVVAGAIGAYLWYGPRTRRKTGAALHNAASAVGERVEAVADAAGTVAQDVAERAGDRAREGIRAAATAAGARVEGMADAVGQASHHAAAEAGDRARVGLRDVGRVAGTRVETLADTVGLAVQEAASRAGDQARNAGERLGDAMEASTHRADDADPGPANGHRVSSAQSDKPDEKPRRAAVRSRDLEGGVHDGP